MPTKNLSSVYRYLLFAFVFALATFLLSRLPFLAACALPRMDGARLDLAAAAIFVAVIAVSCAPAALGVRSSLARRAPRGSGFAASVYNGHAFRHEGDVILQDWLEEETAPALFARRPVPGKEGDIAEGRPALVAELQRRL